MKSNICKGLRMIFLILVSTTGALADVTFQDYFQDTTMRFDYYHTGTATEEHFSPDQMVNDGSWAGSKTQLIDELRLGKYFFEVQDPQTGKILYSRGYSSIYGEWEENYLNNIEYAGEIGAYEGAMYHSHGIYRSQPNCIMFTRTDRFCAACKRAINKVIDQYTE